jgi:hypothetical protein
MSLTNAFSHLLRERLLPVSVSEPSVIIAENFLEESFFNNLENDWSKFQSFWHSNTLQKNPDSSRIDLQLGDKNFELLKLQSVVWRQFAEDMVSEELFGLLFFQHMSVLQKLGSVSLERVKFNKNANDFLRFGQTMPIKIIRKIDHYTHMKNIFFKLCTALKRPIQIFPMCSLAQATRGYDVPVHVDNRYKFLVGLVYFDSVETGGELVLHKYKNSIPILECSTNPAPCMLEEVFRFKPKKNSLVLIINSKHAYHSVSSFSGEQRRFAYIGYGLRYANNAWL